LLNATGKAGEGMGNSSNANDTGGLKSAATRLNTALETFENTVAERRQSDLRAETLEEQVQTLSDRLAAEREKSQKLLQANNAASERIDELIDSIEIMLEPR